MDETKGLEPTPWHRSFHVVEACLRDRRIEMRLVELLGGVPTGRAPQGRVVELPAAVDEFERAAA
jgi:hypothetical protein